MKLRMATLSEKARFKQRYHVDALDDTAASRDHHDDYAYAEFMTIDGAAVARLDMYAGEGKTVPMAAWVVSDTPWGETDSASDNTGWQFDQALAALKKG